MSFETYLHEATRPGPDRALPGVVVVAADKNGKFLLYHQFLYNVLIFHP